MGRLRLMARFTLHFCIICWNAYNSCLVKAVADLGMHFFVFVPFGHCIIDLYTMRTMTIELTFNHVPRVYPA